MTINNKSVKAKSSKVDCKSIFGIEYFFLKPFAHKKHKDKKTINPNTIDIIIIFDQIYLLRNWLYQLFLSIPNYLLY
jgi:hypothetical protein